MKREDLKAIEGLTEEQINAVMRLHGLDAAAHQATVQGLQAQLATAQQGLAPSTAWTSTICAVRSPTDQSAEPAGCRVRLQRCAARCGPRGRCFGTRTMLSHCCRTELHCARARIRPRMSSSIADLKSRKPYLFQQGAPAPQDGAGPQPGAEPQEPTNPIIVPKPRSQGGNAQPTLQEFLQMTGAERMALRTRNPALPAALCFGESCTTLTR